MLDLLAIDLLAKNLSREYFSEWSETADSTITVISEGKTLIVAEKVNHVSARIIVEMMNAAPLLLEAAASSMERATCQKCGAVAQWDYMPSDGIFEYCDSCVPRGCSCNVIDFEDEDLNSPQHRDDQGRELPCCEYDFMTYGFEAATPEDHEKLRLYREESRRKLGLKPLA